MATTVTQPTVDFEKLTLDNKNQNYAKIKNKQNETIASNIDILHSSMTIKKLTPPIPPILGTLSRLQDRISTKIKGIVGKILPSGTLQSIIVSDSDYVECDTYIMNDGITLYKLIIANNLVDYMNDDDYIHKYDAPMFIHYDPYFGYNKIAGKTYKNSDNIPYPVIYINFSIKEQLKHLWDKEENSKWIFAPDYTYDPTDKSKITFFTFTATQR